MSTATRWRARADPRGGRGRRAPGEATTQRLSAATRPALLLFRLVDAAGVHEGSRAHRSSGATRTAWRMRPACARIAAAKMLLRFEDTADV